MPSRNEARRLRALQSSKGRAEHGLFLAEGPRLLGELLEAGLDLCHVLYTEEALEEPGVRNAVERCRERDVRVERVAGEELAAFADTVTPQGVLAVAVIPRAGPGALARGDLLVLDAVQDPGNVGALLRSAEALGAAGAVVLPGTADPWNTKAVRAAAGSLFRLPVVALDWRGTAALCGETGRRVWAADVEGRPFVRGDPAPPAVALVLGNEGRGVREEILASADRRVAVALRGPTESLNVAVAGALLMDRIFSAERMS